MNVNILADNPHWWLYLIFASATMLITLAVFIVFKRFNKV
jgi:hypothetical protein